MAIILIVAAGIVLSVPIAAALLVALASRREDSAWSLNQPPPGPVTAAARRLVGFHAQAIDWPRPRNRAPVHHPQPADAHARPPWPANTHQPVPTSR